MLQRSGRSIDMTGSRMLYNMLIFALPIMISNFCQRFFNAADSIIVGRFCGADALAAVGGNAPIISLFTWGLVGFAIGADVTVSRMYGSRDSQGVHRSVHTAYAIAIISGLIVSVFGIVFARVILSIMGIPEDILEWSVLYLRIYSAGLFFNVVFNFGAACLRSGGDSARPTKYMILAGFVNLILNLLLVTVADLGVAGVAIATALSQVLACVLVTRTLMLEKGILHLDLKAIRADSKIAYQMVTIGMPSMLQNAMFSISSIVVQSSINAFGSLTIAANSAATTLEDFVYVGTGAFNQICTTFTGQNNGAGKPDNIKKILVRCIGMTTCFAIVVGLAVNIFAEQLLSFYATDPGIIPLGIIRLRIVVLPLFMNSIMDILACSMRGMGSSLVPMITSLCGICGLRLVYIFTIFPLYRSLECLYFCYPLSWFVTTIIIFFLWRRCFTTFRAELNTASIH